MTLEQLICGTMVLENTEFGEGIFLDFLQGEKKEYEKKKIDLLFV